MLRCWFFVGLLLFCVLLLCVSAWWNRGILDEVTKASYGRAVTGTAVMARSANEGKKKREDTPKMLLLVNAARPQAPETFVVEATAFPGAMRFGQLLGACQSAWPYSQVPADPEFHVELRDGQAILNIGGYHCQQEGCLTCFLTNCAQLPQCPWHAPQDTNEDRLPLSFSHFICTKDPSTSIVEFVGQLKEGPTDGIIQVFHVCTNEQLRDMSLYRHVTPSKVSLFHSSLSEANTTEDQFQQLVQPFQHVELPQETSRHLFVRAGGPASSLDVWLRERSRE